VSRRRAACAAITVVGLGACGHPATTRGVTPEVKPPPPELTTPRPPSAPPVADRLGDALPTGARARLGTTRWRTGFAVFGLGFSEDGDQVLAASEGLQVFNRASGRKVATYDVVEPWSPPTLGADAAVDPAFNTRALRTQATAITMLGGGKVVLLGAGRVEVLDLTRRVTVAITEAVLEGGDPIAASADGSVIAFRKNRTTAAVWTPGSGAVREFGKHESIGAVTLSADGKYLYTADGSMVARYDLKTGAATYARARDSVYDLDASSGHLVAGAGDRVVALDPTTVKEIGSCHVGETVWSVDVDGYGLVALATDAVAAVCDPSTGKLNPLGTRRSMPYQVQWSPDGEQIAIADEDVVELYYTTRGADGAVDPGGHTAEVTAIAMSASGVTATADDLGTVRAWREDGVPLGEVVHGEGSRVQAMVFAGDDLVAAERDGDVWSTRVGADGKGTGQRWRVAPGGTFPEALAVSPDGTQVAIAVSQRASVDEDTGTLHGVTVLDVQTGRQVRRVATAARTQGLSWTAGGLFARVEGDKLVNVGSSAATPLATLTTATAVTADGSAAIGCDNAGTCRWLRLTDGQVLAEAQALSFRAASVALSPDGAYWAAGSFGGEIVVGRATEARPVVAVRHGDRAVRVAWSPDGKTLLSGSDDTTGMLWGVELLGLDRAR
jgi:WD40 repeat protein